MNNKLSDLKELAKKVTALDLDTAQTKSNEDGCFGCPVCDGSGEIDNITDYCGIDGAALGVQFYGIGEEHLAAEAYFRAFSPRVAIEIIERLEAAEANYANETDARRQVEQNYARLEAELARRDKAVMDAKPIGYFRDDARAVFRVWPTKSDDCNIPVYAAAQPAVVPEKVEECHRCNADGWRADEMGMVTCSCSRGKSAHEKLKTGRDVE